MKARKKKKDYPDRSFSGIKNQQMVKTTHRKESEVPNSVGLYTYPVIKGIPVIKGVMTIPNLRELIDPGTHLVDTKGSAWKPPMMGLRSRVFPTSFPFLPDVLFG